MTPIRTALRAALDADPRSAAAVARAAGMSRQDLNRLLGEGSVRDAALSTWERVAGALGLRVTLAPEAGRVQVGRRLRRGAS